MPRTAGVSLPSMIRLLVKWLLSAAALLFVAYVYSGVEVKTFTAALIAAFVIGLLNAVVRPILVILTLPVTVVIRTKDRPALLREAIGSVRAGGYPADVVVVNDGGAPVDVDANVVVHPKPRGRSEAMNSGATSG